MHPIGGHGVRWIADWCTSYPSHHWSIAASRGTPSTATCLSLDLTSAYGLPRIAVDAGEHVMVRHQDPRRWSISWERSVLHLRFWTSCQRHPPAQQREPGRSVCHQPPCAHVALRKQIGCSLLVDWLLFSPMCLFRSAFVHSLAAAFGQVANTLLIDARSGV